MWTTELDAMAKPPKRMNRRTFWTWAIPIVLAHLVLTFLFVKGSSAAFWGNVDTALIIFLAVALTRRFHDIGWPGWPLDAAIGSEKSRAGT